MLASQTTDVACPSANVRRDYDGNLEYDPCRLPAHHHGRCHGRGGARWTRLEELLRQDGLRLAAGGRVAPLRAAS